MSLQGPLHLDVPAVVGVHEVGTDQQEDDPSCVEVPVNLPLPLGTRSDLAVVPVVDDPEPLEDAQGLQQLTAERLVLVGVGEEDLGGVAGG